MTYYICIVTPGRTFQKSVAQLVSVAVSNHQALGGIAPNLINEPMTFLAVNDRKAIKGLGIKPEDTVRLSVEGVEGGYRSFNLDSIKHVMDVFDEIKSLGIKVESNVAYVS